MSTSLLVNLLALLLPGAVQDWRSGAVSNLVPAAVVLEGLFLRLSDITNAPWWAILTMSAGAFSLWQLELIGGADAKTWIGLSLWGMAAMQSAALGLTLWLPLERLLRGRKDDRLPAFPGYALGLLLVLAARTIL